MKKIPKFFIGLFFTAMLLFTLSMYSNINAQYTGKTVHGLVNEGKYEICKPWGGSCDVSAQQVPEKR